MSVEFIAKQYQAVPAVVACAVAVFSAYLVVELVRRVRAADHDLALGWLFGGALCAGTSLWAEQVIGLLSLYLPMPVGFDAKLIFLSWCPAVLAQGAAIVLLSRAHRSWGGRSIGVLALSAGVCGMHFLGIAALGIEPDIVWDPSRVWRSLTLALVCSLLASVAFRMVFDSAQPLTRARKLSLAVPCGLALRSTQWAVLSAANIPAHATGVSGDLLSASALADLAAGVVLLLGLITGMARVIELRLQGRSERLTRTLKRVHGELETSAYRDALTQLPNRQGFEHRLSVAALLSDQRGDGLTVLLVNLDGFKVVNDSFGHAVGDNLLVQTATRLNRLVRRDDLLAHAAGDEFLLLLQGAHDAASATQLATRIGESLGQSFLFDGHELVLSCSIGIALYPQQGPSTMLTAHAAAAMQAAKRAGGAMHRFFEPGMLESSALQIDLQRDLRQAITHNQLTLHYQPKRHARTGRISGVEALLRWRHPVRGMVSPAEFIPVAERFGLIGMLGNWVIEQACLQIRCWLDQGLRMPVAINLSVHQLRQPDLEARIRRALAEQGVEPNLLLCEITESVAMENTQASMQVFERLAAIGVQLSIDDFGTGYSSLSYLRKLPASQLKIDRSFVQDLDKSSDARAIVEAVVRLAHALDLCVVAEGVETRAQQDILLALGCDELQGFLLARPMPADALLDWSRQDTWGNGLIEAPAAS